jgi:hypothetical protein
VRFFGSFTVKYPISHRNYPYSKNGFIKVFMLNGFSKELEGKEVTLNIAQNPISLLDILCGPTRLVRVWVYPSALESLL